MRLKIVASVIICIGFFLGNLTGSARAQSTFSGDITGTVSDRTGAVIPHALIVAQQKSTDAKVTVSSSESGSYRIPALAPGIYTLTITAASFSAKTQTAVVSVGQVTRADVTLGVAGSFTQVEVNDSPQLLQTGSGSITTTLNTRQVSEIPNPGNDFTDLAQTSPGAVMSTRDSQGGVGNFSSYGLPTTSNLNTINGENENDPFVNSANVGAFNMLLGNNDIAEVTVVSNGSAEYGALGGAQVTGVTKSGGNAFHGNAQYGWNGRALNANNYFNVRSRTPRPFDNVNQWAASIGGPILKNKTFFFVDFEGLRIILPTSNLAVIPSPSFEALALSSVPASEIPFYKQIFNIYNNAPGVSRATAVSGNPDLLQFQATPNVPNNEWLLAGRVDQVLGAKDRFFVHVRIDRGLQAVYTDPINPAFDTSVLEPMYDGQLNENHVFSANVMNQFLFTTMHYSGLVANKPQGLALFPGAMDFQGNLPLSQLGGIQQAFPQGRNVTQYSFADNFIWTTGRHSLKFGGEFKRDDVTDFDVGILTVPLYPAESRSDFLAGNSTALEQNFPTRSSQPIALYTLGMYAQDQWQVRPNLTITAGVRSEHFSNPLCRTGCVARFAGSFAETSSNPSIPYDQMIKTGLQQAFNEYQSAQIEPRLSFAWSPKGESAGTVLRGAFGMFADYFPVQVVDNMLSNIPSVAGFFVSGGLLDPSQPGSATSLASASNKAFTSGFANGGSYTSISNAVSAAGGSFSRPGFNNPHPGLHYPTYEEWNFQVQQQLGKSTSLSAAYFGDHGYHELVENDNVNAYNNPATSGIPFVGLPLAPQNPSFSGVTEVQSNGVSNYNGLVITGVHRSKHLIAQVNYTWSHALDEISNGGLYTVHSASIVSPINPFNLRQVNYGNADYDVRQSLTGSYVYSVPYFGGPHLLTDSWQLAGTVFTNSGFPFSVLDSATAGALQGNNYESAVLADQFKYGSNKCTGKATKTPCLASSEFGTATSFGSQRRNQLFGPDYFDTDLSLFKGVKLRKGSELRIGAQFFNVLNHPNFTHPGNDVANPQYFGLISGTVSTPTSLLGENLGGDASPRMIELVGKLTF